MAVKHQQKKLIWLILLSTLISACGEVAAAPITRFEPCLPGNNSYEDAIDSYLVSIYENGVASMSDAGTFNSYKQQAFTELVNRVYAWTDSVVINAGEKNIEITITYISPDLAQIIVINDYLYQKNNNFTGRLDEQVKSQIAGIIARNEHIFFMTFIGSPSNNSVRIDFPLSELELTNTSNLTVRREHDDHNLERPILLKNELEYGFFNFPMAVIKDGSCQTVLEKARDTSIVIGAPRMMINGTDFGPQSWKYKYGPLIDMTSISNNHQNRFPLIQPVDQITPTMGSLSPGIKEDQNFWISLARIIWLETIYP
jgi:hypothetical protein